MMKGSVAILNLTKPGVLNFDECEHKNLSATIFEYRDVRLTVSSKPLELTCVSTDPE